MSVVCELRQQILAQHDRLVVLGIARAEQQRDRALGNGFEDRLQTVGMRVEFRAITAHEFAPAFGIVAEPAAQLVAWRGVAQPGVEMQFFFRHAARPHSIDEKTRAALAERTIISSADADPGRFHDVGMRAETAPALRRRASPPRKTDDWAENQYITS